jgi:uncharacterized protein YjbI with pentapeptide repeats
MVQHNPNSPPSPLGKAKAELKSLLQQAAIVFGCFVVMVLVTGGRPPGWMVPLTFLLSGGIVVWLEHKRDMADSRAQAVDLRQPEESTTSSVVQFPDRLTPPPDAELSESTVSSQSAQDVPIHLLQEGRVEEWNKWREREGGAYLNLEGADFTNADLRGANLTRANLRGTNLTRANLNHADLNHANLNYVNLYRANLYRANLTGADLTGAILSGADFTDAHLKGAVLRGSILGYSNLSGVVFQGANLSGAHLSFTTFVGVILEGAVVENARFGEGLGLSESQKLDLKQRGAIFTEPTNDREFTFR